eukprot:TRINITY_DN922_c2_g1_i3.p1 TRINITY_DN922_c2_g1~~TRINITY_DN922_c2_g1_i3.p1  ORF type:complete len:349 (+),score=27.10 TRINITY_DN922_c2_g1_i3:140-1186(+)
MKVTIDITSSEEIEVARSMITELQKLIYSIQQVQVQPSTNTLLHSGDGIVGTDVNITQQQEQHHAQQLAQDQLSQSKESMNPEQQRAQQVVQNQENIQQHQQQQQRSQTREQEQQQMKSEVMANGENQLHPPHQSPPQTTQNSQSVQNDEQSQVMATLTDQMSTILRTQLGNQQCAQAIIWVQGSNNATEKQVADVYFRVVSDIMKEADPENYLKYIQILNYLPNELLESIKRRFVEQIVHYLLRPINQVDKDIVYRYVHALAFMHQENLLRTVQVVGVGLKLLKQGNYLQAIMLLCKLAELSTDKLKAEAGNELEQVRKLLDNQDFQDMGSDLSYGFKYFQEAMGWQ